MLKAATDWLAAGALGNWPDTFAVADSYRGQPVLGLRFETILWGGDELAFVMPAWLATTFVEGFFRHSAGWTINNDRTGESFQLTHAVGVAIGHVKVPIRQLRTIAKDAADAAKEAGLRSVNSVTFEIFESLHPPDDDLGRWRKSVFGDSVDDNELAKKLALPGDFSKVLARFEAIVRGESRKEGFRPGFPRSQIYTALRKLREQGKGVGESGADAVVEAVIDFMGSALVWTRGWVPMPWSFRPLTAPNEAWQWTSHWSPRSGITPIRSREISPASPRQWGPEHDDSCEIFPT